MSDKKVALLEDGKLGRCLIGNLLSSNKHTLSISFINDDNILVVKPFYRVRRNFSGTYCNNEYNLFYYGRIQKRVYREKNIKGELMQGYYQATYGVLDND